MNDNFFKEFEPVSSKQWKQKIQFDLQGADYNKMLVWNTNENISVKPFYHPDEFTNDPLNVNTKSTKWNICQSIFVANIVKSNQKALSLIKQGADSIKFIIPSKDISIKKLLLNIETNKDITCFFELQFISESFIKELSLIFKNPKIHVQTDIIGNLSKSGNWFVNLKADFLKFKTITNVTNSLTINGDLYQNSGANIVQQLAYTLSHANEYLNYFDTILSKEKKESLNVIFNIAVGSNYFFEIAKLRALRILWQIIATEYHINLDCHITATPTKRNKTLYDSNHNILRTTTECMSAILGGANTICNLPYDVLYHKDNDFSERIARNQLLILKHESYFNKIENPCDGAFYIESLTTQLAEKALALFKDIEKNGGFLKQLKEGVIQRKIKENAKKEQMQFDTNEEILVGANKYSNLNEKIKDNIEIYPFLKTNQRKTLIEPIIEYRLSEKLEQQRLKNEKNNEN